MQNDGEHSCHIKRMVTCQEDIVHARKTCKDNVENHTQTHNDCGSLTKVLKRHRYDCLIVGNNSLHIEGIIKNLTKCKQ